MFSKGKERNILKSKVGPQLSFRVSLLFLRGILTLELEFSSHKESALTIQHPKVSAATPERQDPLSEALLTPASWVIGSQVDRLL